MRKFIAFLFLAVMLTGCSSTKNYANDYWRADEVKNNPFKDAWHTITDDYIGSKKRVPDYAL